MPEKNSNLAQTFRSRWALLGLMVIYTILRLPALMHQAGGQDEQFFSVPGWTVYREGIPRIPYLPSTNRATFFENADRCVMALPPGLFYAQAPFFAMFPPGYPTSRLPSFCGALALIALTYALTRQLGGSVPTGLLAASLLTISRPLMFTGILARPDLLCCLGGVLVVMLLFRWHQWDRDWLPLTVGALCGLAALFHPFALVFFILAAAAFSLCSAPARENEQSAEPTSSQTSSRTNPSANRRAAGSLTDQVWSRARRLVLLGVGTFALFALWLPLIAAHRQEFFSQFYANVLERSGPGLFSRLLWPFPSLAHQFGNLYEFVGPWQMALLGLLLAFITWQSLVGKPRVRWDWLALSWSSIYLTATVAGLHPTLGYWLFPTIILFACGSAAATQFAPSPRAGLIAACALIVVMLPGAGLKTSWIYLRHFGQTEYHSGKFIRQVLADLPQEGLFVADLSFAFDVYLSGRQTLLSGDDAHSWGTLPEHYDFLVLAWNGMDRNVAQQFGAQQVKLVGDPKSLGRSYVYIYSSSPP